jgi:outer membrane protein insertion porin family
MKSLDRSWVARLLLAALLLVQVQATGQVGDLQSFEGKVIASVEYVGNRTLAEDTLLFYLGLEPGSALDQKDLNKRLRELWDTGLVDDVRIEGRASGEEVALTVTLEERPVLSSIDYVGLKRVSRSDIEDRIGTDRIQVFEGDNLRLGELKRLERSIEELYREKGFRFADARFTSEEISPGERRVTFTVDEGNRVRIEDIKFEGNTVYSDWRLRLFMSKTKESNPLWRLTKKDVYNPAKLQEDLVAVADAYKKLGYKNVTIGEPSIEVRAKRPNAPSSDEKKRRMYVTIPIEEGERWKFGEVTIEGNEKYSDQALLGAFQYKKGDWLKSKKLEEGIKAIDDVYKNTGYINAQVAPEIVENEERIADLIVHVDEGDQFRVGRIEFDGNSRTRDKVLRRELRIHEGLLLSLQRIQNSLLKIKQLGYFAVDEEDPVQILNVDEKEKTIDLIIKGKEADRTELQFGGGWSEFDGFFGQLSLRTQNFLGRGETLAVQVQSGRTREYLDLSYFIPWFLDKPQTVGVQVFSRDTDYGVFLDNQDLRRTQEGGSLTYGRSFGLFNSVSMTYLRSKIEDTSTFFVTDEDGNPVEINSDLNFTQSALRPVYLYNSVDSPFEPTRGTKVRLSAEYAGGFLGATQSFYRPDLTFTYYKPFNFGKLKTVFGFNLRGGYIEPFDGYELSRLDRFFLGGDSSVRGFPFRSITVLNDDGTRRKDDTGFFDLGGDKYAQVNLEYHFLTKSPFRFLLFVDAGGVYAEDQNVGLDGLRYSAGLEVRVLLPVFGAPLRFIYSKNLDPLPEDTRFDGFDFTIGTSF